MDTGLEAVRIAARIARPLGIDPGEILGAVWEGVDRAAGKGIGGPALTRAARYAVVDYLRWQSAGGWGTGRGGKKQRLAGWPESSGGDPYDPPGREPDDAAERREAAAARVRKALASLPTDERQVVDLYFGLGGLPARLETVGAALGRSEAWASVTLAAGLGRLRGRVA